MIKKRQEDLISKSHISTFAVAGLVSAVLFIFSFKTMPEILTKVNILSNHKLKNFVLNNKDKNSLSEQKIYLEKLHSERGGDTKSYFKNLNLVAKSYIVYDTANQKILGSSQENEIMPLASLTKVVTAMTALKIKNKDTEIVINSTLMRPDESLDPGLYEGQKWRLDDLLKYALTISSNSAMDIIASSITYSNEDFVADMNNYVKELGFNYFTFNSASGLDYGDVIGGKGSAIEYAKFFEKAYTTIPNIMSYTINSTLNLRGSQDISQIQNTNKDASHIVGLMASKTGFTDAAGGNLAIMFNYKINRPIVIVVLGSTYEDRFKDVEKLYNATLQALN